MKDPTVILNVGCIQALSFSSRCNSLHLFFGLIGITTQFFTLYDGEPRAHLYISLMAAPRWSTLLALVVLWPLGVDSTFAEAPLLPEAPSHRFFDRPNMTAFGLLGGLVALDGVHTQLMLRTNRYTEGDPLARPFVNHGWQGQLAGSALGYGTALSASYMLHRTGHHKIERWATWLFIGAEAANDTHNLLLSPGRVRSTPSP
jgi:hypothetical protein